MNFIKEIFSMFAYWFIAMLVWFVPPAMIATLLAVVLGVNPDSPLFGETLAWWLLLGIGIGVWVWIVRRVGWLRRLSDWLSS